MNVTSYSMQPAALKAPNQAAQWLKSNSPMAPKQQYKGHKLSMPKPSTKPVQRKTESTNQESQPHAKANVK